jgi:hypothetical protein
VNTFDKEAIMKRNLEKITNNGTVLVVTLAVLVGSIGASLLHAFSAIA